MDKIAKLFQNRVRHFIHQGQLLDKQQMHLVALSGGEDSVALLLVLTKLGYRVEAVHCNFHLRGKESDRDETFCSSLCEQLGVRFHCVHFDTLEYAALHKVSIEMAARELRYRYFEQLRCDIGAATICIAHHQDDSVETFLINLIRGTGIHGLTGISAKNKRLVRPLLCVGHKDIQAYLDALGQKFVLDSTNMEPDVVRNKIRLQVLPMLEQINAGVKENIIRTMSYLQGTAQVFDETVSAAVFKATIRQEPGLLILDKRELKQSSMTEFILFAGLSKYSFTPNQIEEITRSLFSNHIGKIWYATRYKLVIDRNTIIVEENVHTSSKAYCVPEIGIYNLSEGIQFRFSEEAVGLDFVFGKGNEATVDLEQVVFPLTIRNAQQGDRFIPYGMKGSKLVSDYLTDCKRTVFEKERQLVVEDADGRIVWLVNERIDNRFKMMSHSTTCLRIIADMKK